MQRTLRFAQYLPKHGWRPIVLTVHPRAYDTTSESRGSEVPPGLSVHRAFGLDAARHLSIVGRYPRALAIPDRWGTWRHWAIRKALRLLRTEAVDAIWTTFPVATAHSIGLSVAQQAGVPWIAEFRDPMWQGEYPPDPVMNRTWLELERQVFETADRVVVVTPGALDVYAERFGEALARKLVLIENGYDEQTFRRASGIAPTGAAATARPLVLLHSGVVYPSERDPSELFKALAQLKRNGALTVKDLQVILRASGNDALYQQDLVRLGIDDLVRLEPAVDYLSALREMLTADGLLILQASNCNAQVPAKLYEYLRAGRPILALTDPVGDTARTLRTAGVGTVARLDSAEVIEKALMRFLAELRDDTWIRPSAGTVAGYSREAQTARFAQLLDGVVSQRAARSVADEALA